MNAETKQQCHLELKYLLLGQFNQLKALNHYFAELKSAIAENKLDDLNSLLAENKAANNEIEELDITRKQLLEKYGFEASAYGFRSCITDCDKDNVLARHYQLFTTELEILQKSIRVGRLLAFKGQDRIRRTLQSLVGLERSTSMTYASNGDADHSVDRRHLAQV